MDRNALNVELQRRWRDEHLRYFLPNEKQWLALRAMFEQGKKNVYFFGGNRSGKSVFLMIAGAVLCLGERLKEYWSYIPWLSDLGELRKFYQMLPFDESKLFSVDNYDFRRTPVGIWVVSVDYRASKDVMQRLFMGRDKNGFKWIPDSEYKWKESDKTMNWINGSFMTFKSCDSETDKFAGACLHALLRDEETPEGILDECTMRIVDTLSMGFGFDLAAMTPAAGMTYTYDKIYEPFQRKGRDADMFEDTYIVEVSMYDNIDNIGIEAIRKVEKKFANQPEMLAMRRDGKFIQLAGVFYKEFKRNVHVISRDERLMRDLTVYVGIDPGWHAPTAVLWLGVNRDGEVFALDELYVTETPIADVVDLIHEKNRANRIEPVQYLIDPATMHADTKDGTSDFDMWLKEFRRIRLEKGGRYPLVPANNKKTAGFAAVRAYLSINPDKPHRFNGTKGAPRLWFFENCKRMIWEISKLPYKRRLSEKLSDRSNATEDHQEKDDHLCDALRYLCVAKLRFRRTLEYVDPECNCGLNTCPQCNQAVLV